MRKPAVVAMTLVMFSLGTTLAVVVAGSASAASPTGKKTTTARTKAPSPAATTDRTTTTTSPGDAFFVINGTVNAASDHEIIGSSAFPNFTKGAVDNYYSMAHSHVDNSPFAEGTASPADTGPIGQTAAAGNTQQPQYADARWPGDSGKATYGNQGGPYATAEASEYHATADASEATNGLSGPGLGGVPTLALPAGFDARLRQALAGWKAKWQGRLDPTKPTPPGTPSVPKVPKVPRVPKVPTPGLPTATVPSATVTTPVATVTTPNGAVAPAPPVTVPPPPPLPSASAKAASRSLASRPLGSAPTPGDGESLLTSSTSATLVDTGKTKTDTTKTGTTKSKKTKSKKTKTKPAKPAKVYALVTSGESSVGRVTLGGGQIVIEGIHVTASITNDGTPTYKAAVSVASATIGGVPVTIDQDGVHVAGQGQGVPYQQASDALNGALKQAGIQLFLVAPEVTKCEQSGMGSGSGGGPNTTSGDQSGTTSSCGQTGGSGTCEQTGPGAGLPPMTTPPSGNQSDTTSSCDQTGGTCAATATGTDKSTGTTTTSSKQSGATDTTSSCDQTGTTCNQSGTATGGGTGTGGVPGIGAPTTTTTKTTTTSSTQTGTTTTSSWCDQSGALPTTSTCGPAGTATGTTTTSNDQADTTDTTTTMGSGDQFGLGTGMTNATEQTVTATGVHVVFTQPVNQSGVPSQYVEHILGEVYVDSLAVPAGPLPDLGLSGSLSSSSSSCLGGHSRGAASGVSTAGGGSSSTGGVGTSGAASGSTFGSTQGTAGSTGNSLPVAFAQALRKPLWLLLAYLVWQALVIGTGWSLWNWRRGGAA